MLNELPIESVPDQVLWECLCKAASSLHRLICFANALDEMDDVGRVEFYNWINGLVSSSCF
jgi:hypothetical protein